MTTVTTDQIKALRESTGAGMSDCRKALVENGGDIQAATDWLRTKGLASAAKKSGRVAAEGVVAVASAGNTATAIELNSETDFVARNEKFQALAAAVAKKSLEVQGDFDKLKDAVQGDITNAIATIGENMNLRRSAALTVAKGAVATYIHNAVASGMGKIAVLVALESEGDAAKLETLGKQIAMHIAAARPEALSTADVDSEKLERERAIFREQATASGKPADVVEKMVEGRVRKYYEEVVLRQLFVMDGKTKISAVVEAAAKDVGAPVRLTGFVSFRLGEGIEKAASDFAAEVAAAAGTAAA